MSSTLSKLRGMEETEYNPPDASRAREKGAESHLFSSLSQKEFLKTSYRALGSRRVRKMFTLST